MVPQRVSRVATACAPVSPVGNRRFGTLSTGAFGKGATKAKVVGSRNDKAVDWESVYVQHTDGNIPSDTAMLRTCSIGRRPSSRAVKGFSAYGERWRRFMA